MPNKTLHPTAARPLSCQSHRMFSRPIRSGHLPPAAVGELCVRLKSMRTVLAMVLVTSGLVVGCAHRSPQPSSAGSLPSDLSASVILDNHGGFSHAGRRVALQADGSYTD